MTHRPLSPKSLGRARSLRRSMTDAERLLWSQLRAHRFEAKHFRRQVPIGPYTADFVCHDARLVVEVDGGQHADDDERRRDDLRTRWLAGKGYRVLRFWNHEIFSSLEGVMDAIHDAVTASVSNKAGEGRT